jgi:SAM-dependent methyltransferase
MMRHVAAFATRLYLRLFRMTLRVGYRSALKTGLWRDELIKAVAPGAGERILEVSAEGFSSSAELARRYPTAHFTAVHPKATSLGAFAFLSNLEHLPCCDGRIQASGASFDKVVCALALHALQPQEKIALLKEMRRVLRSGGTLHLADLDVPSTPRKGSALRATSHLFGPDSAKPHLDGTWFNMIERAGFARVRREKTCSEILGQVAIVRARRS